jgi:hypothetical protein
MKGCWENSICIVRIVFQSPRKLCEKRILSQKLFLDELDMSNHENKICDLTSHSPSLLCNFHLSLN